MLIHPNAHSYRNWLFQYGFRADKFALTFVDIDIMVLQVLQAYRITDYPYSFKEKLENFFVDTYTESYKHGLYYKETTVTLGEKAFTYLKNAQDWNAYTDEYRFMDLFNRCILFDFKNNPQIKKAFKSLKN